MRQRVVDRQAFQGSVAAKRDDRFATIDLPDGELSQLDTCRLEKLFDVAPPMVRLVASYEMSASGQRVVAKRSARPDHNKTPIYPWNCGIKLHKCKDD